MTTDPECELCSLIAKPTEFIYHEDEVCSIFVCDVCDEPMVAWKQHGIIPPMNQQEHMFKAIFQSTVGTDDDRYQFDAVRYRFKDHWHAHLRPIGRIIHDR